MKSVYKSYMNIINNLSSVRKANEVGDTRSIFGKPFEWNGSK